MLTSWSALPGLRELTGGLTPKLAGAMFVALVALTSAVVGYGTLKALQGPPSPSPAAATETESRPNPCASLFTYQCIRADSQDYSSLDDVTAVASFGPAVPEYVPAGYEPVIIRHTRPEGTNRFVQSQSFKDGCPGCDPRLSHDDQVGIYYRNASGQQLAIIQGFPAYLPFHDGAPADQRGTVRIGDREAYWVRGLPGRWDEPQIFLYLEVGRVGSGWEVSPDRSEVIYGSPMSYSITSNGLPLEELVKIAESVKFD